jgi:hypothetical protein
MDLLDNPVGYRTSFAEFGNFFQKSPNSAIFWWKIILITEVIKIILIIEQA